MKFIIRPARKNDLAQILYYAQEYGLDIENANYKQFYIAEIENNLVGFGRIKQYINLYELATIGVIEKYRKNGVGKKIIEKLLSLAPSEEIWITTLIPEYFKQFGFVEDKNIPDELFFKSQRLCRKLSKDTNASYYMRFINKPNK